VHNGLHIFWPFISPSSIQEGFEEGREKKGVKRGEEDSDSALLSYCQIYADRPDPIVFLPIAVSTSGRVYEDFARQLFLHEHHEASILTGELPEESEQFRFLPGSRLSNLKDSVGLILVKVSVMRVTIPIDLSTRPLIPLPRFLNSRRVPPLLNQSLVLIPQQSV
jgi:hypothetical protein